MDRRWIYILLLCLIAAGCGYLIASTSNSVGNAITDVNTSMVTLPQGFGVQSSGVLKTELIQRDTGELILIKDFGKVDVGLSEFNKKLDFLSKDKNCKVLDNSTDSNNRYTLYTVSYENNTDGNSSKESVSYLYLYNRTYFIKQTGYSSTDKMSDNLDYVVKSLRLDYKKSQE